MENAAYKDYETFGCSELICDPFFQQWAMDTEGGHAAFWNGFLEQYPGKRKEVAEACRLLNSIRFAEHLPAEGEAEAAFDKHWQQIAQAVIKPVRYRWMRTTAVAATISALAVGVIWHARREVKRTIATQYGATGRVILPDSSVVVLNAHSSLVYAASWNGKTSREVWLKGEGYFEVVHGGGNAVARPFRVHTDNITVDVLGTRFDIRERRAVTEVALESGKIALSFPGSSGAAIVMKPGEVVTYRKENRQLLRDTVNAADYSAWKKNRLVLRNPTVEQIVHYLEDNFGKPIRVEDSALLQKQVNGPILYDNLNDALFILSAVLKVKVIKEDSVVILRPVR